MGKYAQYDKDGNLIYKGKRFKKWDEKQTKELTENMKWIRPPSDTNFAHLLPNPRMKVKAGYPPEYTPKDYVEAQRNVDRQKKLALMHSIAPQISKQVERVVKGYTVRNYHLLWRGSRPHFDRERDMATKRFVGGIEHFDDYSKMVKYCEDQSVAFGEDFGDFYALGWWYGTHDLEREMRDNPLSFHKEPPRPEPPLTGL